MKKILCIILILLMIMTVLVGCNDEPNKGKEVNVNEIKLTDGVGYRVDGNTLYFALAADVEDSYICNATGNEDGHGEYWWTLYFTDGEKVYAIETSWYKQITDKYPENVSVKFTDMPSKLSVKKSNDKTWKGTYSKIALAEVTYKKGVITWKVEIPSDVTINTNNIEIFDCKVQGSSAIYSIIKGADSYIEAGQYDMAYQYLTGCCNEVNYSALIDKINEVLPKVFGRNVSYKIEGNKLSFTMDVESEIKDINLNSSRGCWPGVQYMVAISFTDKKVDYGVSSYYITNTEKDGWDYVVDIEDLDCNVFKNATGEAKLVPEWTNIGKAEIKVNGKSITWTFDIPEGMDAYHVCIRNIQEENTIL